MSSKTFIIQQNKEIINIDDCCNNKDFNNYFQATAKMKASFYIFAAINAAYNKSSCKNMGH
ncbi:MAG: hypothetical protein U9R19_19015 [Bacteroidota bacterium]|nr:hypothetical protein [Bacteroidota bacterium]